MKKPFFSILLPLLFFSTLFGCENGVSEINDITYYETVQNLVRYENSRPKLFLEADGRYSENFWGDKFDIDIEITSDAKVASFKDVEIRVTYYSKTKSVITTNDYTLYKVIPPQKVTKAKMKIDNYRDVETIGWEVISAISAN